METPVHDVYSAASWHLNTSKMFIIFIIRVTSMNHCHKDTLISVGVVFSYHFKIYCPYWL